MGLTLEFLYIFLISLIAVSPVILFLIFSITMMGLLFAKIEGISKLDAIYCAFITATTIGYGDITPTHRSSKILSICIGFCGLIFTGIIVALAVNGLSDAFSHDHETVQSIKKVLKK